MRVYTIAHNADAHAYFWRDDADPEAADADDAAGTTDESYTESSVNLLANPLAVCLMP